MIATMRDMVRWLQHLRQDHRNPKSLFARMTEPFRLADGTTAYYRRGISVREHRGLVGWGHGGFTGTDYVFWPEIDLVVANFCNSLGGVSKSERSLQITDAFLEEQPELLAGSAGQPGPIDPKPLPLLADDAALLAGTFVELENGYILESPSTPATTTVAGGDSFRYQFLGSETRVVKRSERRYETPSSYWPLRLSIEPASCGACARPDLLVRHADWPAARRFVRVKPGKPADVRVEDYLGHYGSDQLGICYSVVRAGKALDLLVAAGVAATQILHMTPLAPDIFRARSDDREFKDLFALGTISVKFRRGAGGRVRGMRLSLDRVRDLDFTRL
jgi:hypothetical protein